MDLSVLLPLSELLAHLGTRELEAVRATNLASSTSQDVAVAIENRYENMCLATKPVALRRTTTWRQSALTLEGFSTYAGKRKASLSKVLSDSGQGGMCDEADESYVCGEGENIILLRKGVGEARLIRIADLLPAQEGRGVTIFQSLLSSAQPRVTLDVGVARKLLNAFGEGNDSLHCLSRMSSDSSLRLHSGSADNRDNWINVPLHPGIDLRVTGSRLFARTTDAPDSGYIFELHGSQVGLLGERSSHVIIMDSVTGQVTRHLPQQQFLGSCAYSATAGLIAATFSRDENGPARLSLINPSQSDHSLQVSDLQVHHQAPSRPIWIDDNTLTLLYTRAGLVEEYDIRKLSAPSQTFNLPKGSRATSYCADSKRILVTQEARSSPLSKLYGFLRKPGAYLGDVWETEPGNPRIFSTNLGELEAARCHFHYSGTVLVWDKQSNLRLYQS